MTELQHFAMYRLQEVALSIMAVVYLTRLVWLFKRFRPVSERQPATGRFNKGEARGAVYSLSLIARPSQLMSTRRHLFLYAQFVAFHLGITAAIALSFILPYAPSAMQHVAVVWIFEILIILGTGAALLRLARRIGDRTVRRMSSPDDYFSLLLLLVWLALAFLSIPSGAVPEGPFIVPFFVITAFILVYVPFSKMSHYLYYPFTRYWLGRSMGRRGVYPMILTSARCSGKSGGESAG